MKRKDFFLVLGVGIAALLLIPAGVSAQSVAVSAENLIASFEGFSPTPYWDVSRWSWGYGTAAPGSSGTISEADARTALGYHVQSDYNYLSTLITRPITTNQWAALLSFSYNLGTGNADNLVENINSGDDAALQAQWMLYVNADGSRNSTLVERRAREWAVWSS